MEPICNQTSWMQRVSGSIPGNVGSYDLCVNSPPGTPATKFCLLIAPSEILNTVSLMRPSTVVGMCLPRSEICTPTRIAQQVGLDPLLNATFTFCGNDLDNCSSAAAMASRYVFCDEPIPSVPASAIAAFAVLCSIFCFVLAISFYDYVRNITSPPTGATSKAAASPRSEMATPANSTTYRSLEVAIDSPSLERASSGGGPKRPSIGARNDGGISTSHSTAAEASTSSSVADSMATPSWVAKRWIAFVTCASLIASFKRWRFFPQGAVTNVFNAIRVLCWLWILASDTYSLTRSIPSYGEVPKESENVLFAILMKESTVVFAISTFLFLGGFSSANVFILERENLKAIDKALVNSSFSDMTRLAALPLKDRICQWIKNAFTTTQWYLKHLLRRAVRVLPLYATIVLMAHGTLTAVGSGPFWGTFVRDPSMGDYCTKFSYTNFLFVNNIAPSNPRQRCFPWCYYFALDLQFFALAPLIVWLYVKVRHRYFIAISAAVVALSISLRGVEDGTQAGRDLVPGSVGYEGSATTDSWMRAEYVAPLNALPHLMIVPYLMGMLFFLTFHEVTKRDAEAELFAPALGFRVLPQGTRSSQWVQHVLAVKRNRVLLIWVSVALGFACIIGSWQIVTHPASVSIAGRATFNAMSIFVWSGCLSASMLPLLLGYGGALRRFLCHRLWCGASRLVFAAYLLHPIIISYYNATRVTPSELQFLSLVYDLIGHSVLTLLVAFVFHLAIEQPLIHATS